MTQVEQPAPPEGAEVLCGATVPDAADFAVLWSTLRVVRWTKVGLVALMVPTFFVGLGMATSGDFGVGTAFMPLAILVGLRLLLHASRGGWSARRLQELGSGEVRYEVDARGVKVTATRVSHDLPWSAFKSFRSTERVLLLKPQLGPEVLLPVRAFTAPTLELVRALLRQKVEERWPMSSAWHAALAAAAIMAFLSVWHFLSIDEPPPRGALAQPPASVDVPPPPALPADAGLEQRVESLER